MELFELHLHGKVIKIWSNPVLPAGTVMLSPELYKTVLEHFEKQQKTNDDNLPDLQHP